ncbi:response regulator [Arcobacter sp. LA11]|uniref:response regulator n=1 Tax=Arcobacter sp. LA11 TaxID=1898176 RepID=UPI000934FB50|nr:response regulator [Arcobacter sp. LA11]
MLNEFISNNILYLESDEKFGTKLVDLFLNNRYEISWAKNEEEAVFKYQYHKPNILICNIILEDKNIINLIQNLKKKDSKLKIVIVTNNFESENLLKCINLGISNYLEKNNFVFEKIISLIEVKNSFANDKPLNKFILGEGFVYNIDTKELLDRNKIIVPLNTQERQLIELLLKNKNNYVPYHQIQSVLGKVKDVSIDSLRTTIRIIRKKTYSDIIKNLSGYGYKINFFSGELIYQTELDEENKVKNKKLLLIEDSIEISNTLKKELKGFSLECDCSLTYNDSKKLIEENTYDYIILNLHLPDKDGIDLLNSIKSISDSRIIVLTADSDIHLKEYLYLQGVLDYVEKSRNTQYLAYTLYKTIFNIENNDSLNNVLVVDSSKLVCDHICDLLIPRNYNVTIKYSITDGLSFLKDRKVDLVIIDLDLLGESCFETLNLIKNSYKELPIILLSSVKKSSTNRDAFKNGASEVLSKPLLAEEFILKVDLWVDYHRKIHQIKSQQQLLNEYKLIVDKASIVSKTDLEGQITYVNETFCKISGYTEEELLGQSHNIVRHHDMPTEVFTEVWDTIKEKKQIWHGQIKNKRKDGSAYYVDSYVMPILNVRNEVVEYIALRNYISEKEFYNL